MTFELPPDAVPVSDDEIEDAPITDDDETTGEDDPAIVDEPPTTEEV